ncbi:hypothetical protein [Streptomyces sp. MUSC 14]|uniref:hypothetical protein n=1 Tax=Streptomyces sp. MUSC 14 TaxID=1354889 RepID=UPI0009A0F3C3|nr:hypothetical protein [Streptomyces sp. MUSC 14]
MGFSFSVRVLVVGVALLTAVIVGMVAGMLAHLDGAKVPACIMRGGASVGATMTVLVLVMVALGVLA